MKKTAWFAVLLVLIIGLFIPNIKNINAESEGGSNSMYKSQPWAVLPAGSGCSAGWLFNPNTGAPCKTSTLPPGCDLGYKFSPVTGKQCPQTKGGEYEQIPAINASCNSLPCTFDGKAITNTWATVDTPPFNVSAPYPYVFNLSTAASVQMVLRSNVWPKSIDVSPKNTMYVEIDGKVVFKESKTYDEFQNDETSDNTLNTIKLGKLAAGTHKIKIYALPDGEHFMFDWFRLEYSPESMPTPPNENKENFKIVLPKAGTYDSSESLKIVWTPYKGDFDYYYVILGNKYSGVQINVSPEQRISKRSTSFKITNLSEVIKEIVANSGGKAADQIQHGYYVTVQPAKIDSNTGYLESLNPSATSPVFTILSEQGETESNSAPQFISWATESPEGQAAGKNVQFTFKASDADNDGLYWRIDWGDGSPESWASSCDSFQGDWVHVDSKVWDKPGTYKIKVTVSDCKGGSDTETLKFEVGSSATTLLSIATNSVSGGYVGDSYYATIEGSGGTGSYSWSVTAGSLPPGLTLRNNRIVCITTPCFSKSPAGISGTPTKAGEYKFTLKLKDSSGAQVEKTFYLPIKDVSTNTYIKMISPNGGESWATNTARVIKWADKYADAICQAGVECVPQAYNLSLIGANSCSGSVCTTGFPQYTIARNMPHTSLEWTVGKVLELENKVPGGAYKIQVCQTGGDELCDMSDNYFKIISGVSSTCPISAAAESKLSANSTNSWGFDVLVNNTNSTGGWTADNFVGYAPQIYAYGQKVHFGEFFINSGSLSFTARDNRDINCKTTIKVTPPPIDSDQDDSSSTSQVLGEKTFLFTQKLGLGSMGTEVVELQKLLSQLGLYGGSYDGKFGKSTEEAVKKFQAINGLTVDGIVGFQVRALLNQ